ncbi:hypothetical protein EB796_011816 [Bugula neritina]|uniref:Uncharacterized protein n=1 Tax=Bugula neritina TaxID=10212 RepID=A0A7J7JU27_BUGNE|nr:hypothetical protein EB796_011816 [Bugula neritina]
MHRIDSQGSEVHRAKLSKLREEWLGREMANLLEPSNHRKMASTASTSDSGLGLSPFEDITYPQEVMLPSHNAQYGAHAATHGLLSEEVLVATIQSEAETSQYIVDMLASTQTMRRRKQQYDESQLTYRRRGLVARQSLYTSSPPAPKQSVWGEMFDKMLNKLKGIETGSESEGDGGGNPYHVTLLRTADYTWVSTIAVVSPSRSQLDNEVNSEPSALVSQEVTSQEVTSQEVTSQEVTSQEVTSQADKREGLTDPSDSAAYWEENWNDESSTSSHVEYCEGCSGLKTPNSERNVIPTFCYKNQNCASFDRSLKEQPSPLDGLQSITFRRPDLLSLKLPMSPIRKTDSNSDVWIEQSDTISNTPSTFVTKNHSSQSKSLTSVWKRIKKLFSNR